MKKETYEKLIQITRISNRAVKIAQEENKKKGLPNVYSRKGKIVFELPDGTLTTKDPL